MQNSSTDTPSNFLVAVESLIATQKAETNEQNWQVRIETLQSRTPEYSVVVVAPDGHSQSCIVTKTLEAVNDVRHILVNERELWQRRFARDREPEQNAPDEA